MSNKEWFVISDIDSFVDATRSLVYSNFGNQENEVNIDFQNISDLEQEELNTVLSFDESITIILNLVKKQRNKTTSDTRYVLDDDIFMEIVNQLHSRMTSNLLHNLVKKGLVESAFDETTNDFIFWLKDNNNLDN